MGRKKLSPTRGITTNKTKTSFILNFWYQGERWRPPVKVSDTDNAQNIQYINDLYAQILRKIRMGELDPIREFPTYSKSKKLQANIVANTLTIEKLLDMYLSDEDTIKQLKPSTLKINRRKANSLIARIGDCNAHTIDRVTLQEALVSKRGQEVTQKTINNEISILRTAFNWYMGKDNTFNNFVLVERANNGARGNNGWKPVAKLKNGKADIDPFTHTEVNKIVAACSLAFEDKIAAQLRNMITVIYWQGLRISEFVGLRWDDINFDKETIEISTPMVEGVLQDDAKTKAGNRVMRMLGDTKKALLNQRAYTRFASEFVFLNPHKGIPFMSSSYFHAKWKAILAKTDIKFRPPKQLRHSWATYALASGEDVRWVAGHLGHTNYTFTADTYYRYMDDLYPNAGKSLEQLREYAPE